jgi:hypothetical protein
VGYYVKPVLHLALPVQHINHPEICHPLLLPLAVGAAEFVRDRVELAIGVKPRAE